MPIIEFKPSKKTFNSTSTAPQIVYIEKIVFNTKDKNWVTRLHQAAFEIKFEGIGQNRAVIKTSGETFTFGSLVTPDHRKPVIDLKAKFTSPDSDTASQRQHSIKQWKTRIELLGMNLLTGESLSVSMIDTAHTLKRIEDWKKRIKDLFAQIKGWLPPSAKLKIGTPIEMYEGQMETFRLQPTLVDTADIWSGDVVVMSIKPKGLWVIGANGRIDIMSKKGAVTMIDIAEQFQSPEWNLLSKDKLDKTPFTQEVVIRLLTESL